ncbi:hypothetical protein Zm00014a_029983 [Zea mays]|uniref:NADP-dependent oxidoreductase domain-containing protein n=1 Tax=Zea mays TaxID=4577 RepID=A0A3L6FBT1_MAIZE|nr:hypothetical protein Zm00014a_029983 [Zea mays]
MADDVDSRRTVISRFTEHRSGNRWQVVNCLHRLGVDYIDLYHICWYVPMFGETEYDPNCQYTISLLAYSPMAMGILSGKYHLSDNCGPPDARMNLFKGKYSEGESRYKLHL